MSLKFQELDIDAIIEKISSRANVFSFVNSYPIKRNILLRKSTIEDGRLILPSEFRHDIYIKCIEYSNREAAFAYLYGLLGEPAFRTRLDWTFSLHRYDFLREDEESRIEKTMVLLLNPAKNHMYD